MGINLNDHVKDANRLFTYEEAEKLFVTAGYKTNLPMNRGIKLDILKQIEGLSDEQVFKLLLDAGFNVSKGTDEINIRFDSSL